MQHDIRCVGCNLGRTAEFTSKIILAIHGALSVADVARRARSRRRCGRAELGPGADVAHTASSAGHRMNGRLGRAVSALAAMEATGGLTKQRPVRPDPPQTWEG